MDINSLNAKLNRSGKLQKFSVYYDIIKLCYKSHDQVIFRYFDQLIVHLSEYLEYDDLPNSDIINVLSGSFRFVFEFIKNIGDQKIFKKYLPLFEKYNFLIEDPVQLAHIYQSFGYFFWLAQNMESSKKFLKLSLDLINETNLYEIPNRYTNLGYIYEYTGCYDKAEELYWQGIKFAQTKHYQKAMFMAYNAMGRLFLSRKIYEKAQKYFITALEIMDKIPQDYDYITTLMNLASTYVFLKNYKKAIECLKNTQQDWLKNGNPEIYYSSFINMAIYYQKLGQLSKADNANAIAFEYAKKNSNDELLFGFYFNQGKIDFGRKKYLKSLNSAKEALRISKIADNIKQQSLVFNLLAAIYMKSGDYEKAIKLFSDAEILIKKMNNDSTLCTILRDKAECYKSIHDYKKAFKTLNQFCLLNQKILENNKINDKLTNELLNSNKSEKNDQLLFKNGYSIISKELTDKIGVSLIGQTEVFKKVIHQALLVADNNNASVLIKGESGTGKELIARLIHYASKRKNAPFIPINSASFSDGLVQSTLFGHEKGAFTNALGCQKGYFEQADSGTIFLDEISEMPYNIQANLLRVLENKKIRRLGSDHRIDIDFRLISATNRNIDQMVTDNLFRFDLLNRINTLEISIPPLRDRIDDIPLLIDFYLQEISNRLKRDKVIMKDSVISKLLSYDFPGNVRELVNIIEKLVIFSKSGNISENDLCFINFTKYSAHTDYSKIDLNLKNNEYKMISIAMEKCNNVQAHAAKLLGISPFALNRKLKKLTETI